MDFTIHKDLVSNSQLLLYNIALIAGFVYLYIKYRKHDVAKYVLFLFTVGIFADFGRLTGLGTSGIHIYSVISTVWAVSLLHKYNFKRQKNILICFVLYIFYFMFVSLVVHRDNVGIILSQSLKYTIPVLSYFLVVSYIRDKRRRGIAVINSIIHDVILAQILFCVIKLIILRATQEGLVGSLTGLNGGGAGTSFPLLGLLWLAYITKMHFSKKFFFFTIGLLFIGFMTGKRAIWLLFPMLFGVLYLYYRVSDFTKLFKYAVPALFAISIFIYLGLRLSPTLNPDKKVWGRFDLEYAYGYALSYSGSSETSEGGTEVEEGDGRLGAALLFWNKLTNIWEYDKEVLLGVGNETIKYFDKTKYHDRDANMGVSYRGGVTGIVFMFFISGIVGVILFFLYFTQIFYVSRKNKIVWILFATTLFDFIFYNGQTVNNVPMMSLMFLLCALLSVRHKSIANQRVNITGNVR